MGRFKNFRIVHACPLIVMYNRLKPLMALSGTVYRLASSMSDHTPVLFNMFEDWNEESVVPHISFVSFVTNYWLLNARFDSYSIGTLWNWLGGIYGRFNLIRIVTSDSIRKQTANSHIPTIQIHFWHLTSSANTFCEISCFNGMVFWIWIFLGLMIKGLKGILST